MRVTPTALPGVLILEPEVFDDERGFFLASFNQRAFEAAIGHVQTFVQDNHSCSRRGVLRGLHYQLPPHAQGKLVRVVHGSAFDVAVDIRRGSPTFGRWFGLVLDAGKPRQLWIPPGFAHGCLALEDDTHILYKVTDDYDPDCERAIAWDDAALGIEWPALDHAPLLSARDAAAPRWAQAQTF
ncbi:MAG: dTDP-4-dehydrorhamnose 3,5-epimerase [Burkholderiaceae bacterium]|nr:dTDP-4-dehydrorhamnose 3,5-epimerase [Burkholderiaceae bacterium]